MVFGFQTGRGLFSFHPFGRFHTVRGWSRPALKIFAALSNIGIDFLEPGMVLARDVRGGSGLVLLGAGAEITERHIQIFRSWGVSEIEVKGTDQDALNTQFLHKLDVEKQAAVDRELDRMFQHNDLLDPVIEELRRICLARETLRASGKV